MGIFKGVLSAVQSAEDRQLRKQQMEDAKIRGHAEMLHQQGIAAALEEHRKAQEQRWKDETRIADTRGEALKAQRSAALKLGYDRLSHATQSGKRVLAGKIGGLLFNGGMSLLDTEEGIKHFLNSLNMLDTEDEKQAGPVNPKNPFGMNFGPQGAPVTPQAPQVASPAPPPPMPTNPTPPSVFMQRGAPVMPPSDLGAMPLMNLPETPPVEPVGFVPGQDQPASVMQQAPDPALNPFSQPSPRFRVYSQRAQTAADREARAKSESPHRMASLAAGTKLRNEQFKFYGPTHTAQIKNWNDEIRHRLETEKDADLNRAAIGEHITQIQNREDQRMREREGLIKQREIALKSSVADPEERKLQAEYNDAEADYKDLKSMLDVLDEPAGVEARHNDPAAQAAIGTLHNKLIGKQKILAARQAQWKAYKAAPKPTGWDGKRTKSSDFPNAGAGGDPFKNKRNEPASVGSVIGPGGETVKFRVRHP